MKHIITALLLISIAFAGFAQGTPAAKKLKEYNLNNKLAIEGYDPVAYFKQGKAVKGKKQFAVTSPEGIMYYCSSAANQQALSQNLVAFEPQYGGWCAYAMGAMGDKVEVDPETFKIINGKLYLYYNAFFNNTLNSWNKDETNLKKKADANWNKLVN